MALLTVKQLVLLLEESHLAVKAALSVRQGFVVSIFITV
jgi:hypothetical protein